jgi:3-hydroxyisobutyrate dehydrogenase-like beta-hydroxyacid dehydrogenase
MAARILASGRELTVYNRDPEKAKPLLEAGAKLAKTPEAALKGAEVIMTMVADDEALDSLVSPGKLAHLADGAIHVSMSTVSVDLTKRLAARHASVGSQLVGCPVFGRPAAAAAGSLLLCLAGPAEAKAKVRPILEPLGKISDLGDRPEGAGAVKLAGNFMVAATMEMLGEAFSLVESHGVAPEAFFELMSSTNFSSPVVKIYGSLVLEGGSDPVGFTSKLAAKDLGLIRAAAKDSLTPMPMAAVIEERILRILAKGWGGRDWSVVGRHQRQEAGLPRPQNSDLKDSDPQEGDLKEGDSKKS